MSRHQSQPILPSEITRDRVYFTFLDGRLTYDCIRCNATCCRGHGYLLNGALQGEAHLRSRPNLHVFVDPDRGQPTNAFISIKNCPPGCFFLTQQGLCGIHVQHGYAAKPETCRLFPFNYFRRAAGCLIVSPHPSLCPLDVTPFGTMDDKSRHDLLIREMQFQGISGEVTACNGPEGLPVDDILALERTILKASETYEGGCSYAEFAGKQVELSSSILPELVMPTDLVPGESQCDGIHHFGEMLVQLLGLSLSRDELNDPSLTRAMVVATPFLRSSLLLRSASKTDKNDARGVSVSRVPYIVFGIYLLAAAARAAGMTSITFQTISRLASSFGDLLLLLSDVSRVMVWKPGVPIPITVTSETDFQTRYLRVARALLPSQQRRGGQVLGEVLSEHCTFNGTERIRFLSLVARSIGGKIVPLAERGKVKVSPWRALGCAVQRSALAAADEDLVSKLVTGKSRSAITHALWPR